MSTFVVTKENSIQTPAGKFSWKLNVEADGLNQITPEIPDSSSDYPIIFSADISVLEAIWFFCDQDITLYTNDIGGGTPIDTLILIAGQGYSWVTGDLAALLITADISALYADNASGAVAKCQFGVLQDISDPA